MYLRQTLQPNRIESNQIDQRIQQCQTRAADRSFSLMRSTSIKINNNNSTIRSRNMVGKKNAHSVVLKDYEMVQYIERAKTWNSELVMETSRLSHGQLSKFDHPAEGE